MELKHLLIGAGILLLIFGGMKAYEHFFQSEDTFDHRLGRAAMEDILDRPDVFGDHVVNLTLMEPGVYRMDTQGLDTARDAGNIAHNSMAALSMAKWEMQAARHGFTIYGYDGEEMIFEVHNTDMDEPVVTLHGRYEGMEYIPSFAPQTSLPPEILQSEVTGKSCDFA